MSKAGELGVSYLDMEKCVKVLKDMVQTPTPPTTAPRSPENLQMS